MAGLGDQTKAMLKTQGPNSQTETKVKITENALLFSMIKTLEIFSSRSSYKN